MTCEMDQYLTHISVSNCVILLIISLISLDMMHFWFCQVFLVDIWWNEWITREKKEIEQLKRKLSGNPRGLADSAPRHPWALCTAPCSCPNPSGPRRMAAPCLPGPRRARCFGPVLTFSAHELDFRPMIYKGSFCTFIHSFHHSRF